MRIKILEVGQVAKEKTYFVLPLKYESDGKAQEKKIFSFNGETYKALKDSKPEQVYDVKLTKDKNGYWQWENVAMVTGQAAASGGRTSNFETPEERAKRQVMIVRQSSLAQAVSYVIAKEKQVESVDEILNLAEQFEEWVMRD